MTEERETADTPIDIYWVNQYAVPPDQPGGTRHYEFATVLRERGHRVEVIASDLNLSTRSYSRRRRSTDLRPISETIGGIAFTWLTAGSYRTNNWRRVLSMVLFGASTFGHLLRVDRTRSAVFIGSSPHLLAALGTWAAARLRRIPFVLEVRDLWPESYTEVSGRTHGPDVTMMRVIADLLYRRADAIIVLAEPNIDHICARGVDREKVYRIPNGVDLDGFSDAPAARTDLSQEGAFTYVYAGAHGPANDLEVVIRAADVLQQRGRSDIRIVLLGDGASKDALVRLRTKLRLTNVRFEEPVPKAEVPATLRTADAGLMILASVELFTYGVSPNKLFDYMGAGLPVLTNVAGVVSEIVAEAGVGTTVPPGDPVALADGMEQMADHPPADATAHGQAFIRAHYDRRSLARAVEDMLVTVLSLDR